MGFLRGGRVDQAEGLADVHGPADLVEGVVGGVVAEPEDVPLSRARTQRGGRACPLDLRGGPAQGA